MAASYGAAGHLYAGAPESGEGLAQVLGTGQAIEVVAGVSETRHRG
jgi:hypothetical protein